MNKSFAAVLTLALAGMTLHAGAAITVHDDGGNAVTVVQPARRIVSLAPHVTELLFAAGGGDRIVGAVSYSDFPPAANNIPRIGDNRQVDIERLIALKPDLIVLWLHGGSGRQVELLSKLGIPMYHSEPHKLADIAHSVQRLGRLMGTDAVAQPAAKALSDTLTGLKLRYANRPPVRLFYQVWDKPLYTLNGEHIVSDAIRLCGGENIFAEMTVTAPVVSIEGVLQRDPEAIFGSSERAARDGGVDLWRRYGALRAVQSDNLFTLDGNLLNRSGPRMVQGAKVLCEKIELARQRRK